MKALTVRQPWANAILQGKDVENRSRYFGHRGLLLIHAAMKADRDALDDPRITRASRNVHSARARDRRRDRDRLREAIRLDLGG